jgi:hypothetical protein
MIEYDTKQMKHRTPGDINYGMTGWRPAGYEGERPAQEDHGRRPAAHRQDQSVPQGGHPQDQEAGRKVRTEETEEPTPPVGHAIPLFRHDEE